MTDPINPPDEPTGMRDRLLAALDKAQAKFDNFSKSTWGWAETGVVTAIGAAALGFGGLIVGAIAGWLVLPAVAAWAGATMATTAAAGTALATGSLLGLNAAGWAGAIGGIVAGALASLVPLSRRTEKKTEYNLQSIITPDIEHEIKTNEFGQMSVDPRNLPHVKMNETTTIKTYRVGDLFEDALGVTTGLMGAFAGAAVGATIAGIVKVSEARKAVYDNYRDHTPRP